MCKKQSFTHHFDKYEFYEDLAINNYNVVGAD